ncbi:MAG TPA: hypothetical protein VNL69_05825 [Bacteroidota bacterium]|nr:hypothetical protein [Bacteroidota bacterium]
MIPLLVFYLHIVAAAAIFTKRYQEEGVGEGLLAVFFMALIFFVGWAMASFIVRLVLPPEGFGPWFTRDAGALVLLTLGESVLYYFYFRDPGPREETTPAPQ